MLNNFMILTTLQLAKVPLEMYLKLLKEKLKKLEQLNKILKNKIKSPQRFFNEVTALKTLDHPNVIKLYEIFEDEDSVYLVQEYWDRGELFDYIVENDHLSEGIAARLFHDILLSLFYWHKNKICHRDLKPENFMLAKSGDETTVKLIDFGLSRSFYKPETTGKEAWLRMRTKVGTAFFMAPEVINKDYSNSWDMWSAGWILYIMLSGYPPFDGENEQEIFEAIQGGQYDFEDPAWESVSDDAKLFICKLLCPEKKRMTAKKALKHSWIKKNVNKQTAEEIPLHHIDRLRNFNNKKRLRQAVLTFLASRVMDHEIEEQTKLFHALDANHDGYITYRELKNGLQDKYSIDDIKGIMNSVDTDKNGAINYNEFIAATLEPSITSDISKIEQAFKFFDLDNNGEIDSQEFKTLLSGDQFNRAQTIAFEDMLREADEDGDGKINLKEFMSLMSVVPN